jgi:NhaC family Na+:H+ antiporter
VPSFALALAIYAVAGGRATPGGTLSDGTLPEGAQRLVRELDDIYALNALALLPLAVVIGGIVLRRPPALTLAASSVLALVLGVAVQGFSVADALVAAVRGFDVGMIATLGLDPASTSELFVKLLARGGLYSMTDTLLVILAAFLLAGALDVSGALDKIIAALLAAVRSTFGLIAATMGSGALLISLTSHGGVTALIVGELFQKAYAERRLAPENLSRSLEDSVTIVEPLLPWTVSAVFMATTLGVPTVEYLPWAAFCFGGPVFSLLYAATFDRTGFGIKKT